MNFLSDTTAPAHPALLDAIAHANGGYAASYGNDPLCQRVEARLKEVFGTDLKVLFTVSGTASMIAPAVTMSTQRGLDGANTRPIAHAPARTA